ncbi:MAG: DUF4317 domain-containing protein [Lachnospiraceae bacterium]|jgi:hypothetical protein|nr:DUF4317 domain-containing protein [Lachnospiraceae bacterium]
MTKQEISEIKKLYTPDKCSISRLCGCYVDGEKNKKAIFEQSFLSLAEEDIHKYFDILKKTLSGSTGKNLHTLPFPLEAEVEGSAHAALLALRDSKLQDEQLLTEFYDRVIESYEYVGNYLILLIHDTYDVPTKTTDRLSLDDASENVYEYILCSICPVDLAKPALSYHAEEGTFSNRNRDWIAGAPISGFLFPAFHDRTGDIHNVLYYSKKSEELQEEFVTHLLACPLPISADTQKETFKAIVEETLGDECKLDSVIHIHEKLSELVEERKEDEDPLILGKNDVKILLSESGVTPAQLESVEKHFEDMQGLETMLYAGNVTNSRSFDVKTPDITVKIKPERVDLINTQLIDGKKCLIIELDGNVEVNGINVHP